MKASLKTRRNEVMYVFSQFPFGHLHHLEEDG